MTTEIVKGVPPGFVESRTRGAFSTHNGPLYHKADADTFRHGFIALPRHCNGVGIVHGGWLSSFADGVLATAVWRATQARSVTLRLNVDFLGMVRPGEWVEGTAEVTRATRALAFVRGEIICAGRAVVRAEGIFKLMRGAGAKAK